MSLELIAATTLVIIAFFYYLKYAQAYAKELIHVGVTAAQTYVMYGDSDAFTAARTVNLSLSKSHKQLLSNLIESIPVDEDENSSGINPIEARDRRSMLGVKVRNDDASMSNRIALRDQLKNINSIWLPLILKPSKSGADNAFVESTRKFVSANLGKKIS